MNASSIQLKNVLGTSELQSLLAYFNQLDKYQRGIVSLQDSVRLFKDILQLPFFSSNITARLMLQNDNQLSFDQFLALLWETEIENGRQKGTLNYRLVQFLQLLEDYRKKCQIEGQYKDADKAHTKIAQIKQKQLRRQKQNLLKQQQSKVATVTETQQSKLIEFNNAWNKYMSDYETAAIGSLEKLKAKHLEQFEREEQKIRQQYHIKIKHSKLYNELRLKEKNLVKIKKYKQAEKLKAYCQELEATELKRKQQSIEEIIQQRTQQLRKHQQAILSAHLRRIESDRTQQLHQRKQDSQKMLMKLKNLKNDIVQKQSIEIKDALLTLRETMCGQSGIFRRSRPRRIESLDKLRIQDSGIQEAGDTRELDRTSFKIRHNSFAKPKISNHSLYDP